jgi:hypothetical protein
VRGEFTAEARRPRRRHTGDRCPRIRHACPGQADDGFFRSRRARKASICRRGSMRTCCRGNNRSAEADPTGRPLRILRGLRGAFRRSRDKPRWYRRLRAFGGVIFHRPGVKMGDPGGPGTGGKGIKELPCAIKTGGWVFEEGSFVNGDGGSVVEDGGLGFKGLPFFIKDGGFGFKDGPFGFKEVPLVFKEGGLCPMDGLDFRLGRGSMRRAGGGLVAGFSRGPALFVRGVAQVLPVASLPGRNSDRPSKRSPKPRS